MSCGAPGLALVDADMPVITVAPKALPVAYEYGGQTAG